MTSCDPTAGVPSVWSLCQGSAGQKGGREVDYPGSRQAEEDLRAMAAMAFWVMNGIQHIFQMASSHHLVAIIAPSPAVGGTVPFTSPKNGPARGTSRTSWDASFDHPYAGALKSNGTGIYCRPCQRCLAMTPRVIPHVR